MLSPEPAKAKEFFSKVLGWTFGEIPGMGYSVKVGGKDIGGLFDAKNPDGSPHAPMIGVMVKVESADATSQRATDLGGKGQPAFDVGPQGRMAVIHDPNGANIDVWQPKGSAGTDCDMQQHGAPSWFETLTVDADKVVGFYEKLFGWTSVRLPMANLTYITFQQGTKQPIAGMMQMDDAMKAMMSSHWGVYFTVNDAEAAVKTSEAAGGTTMIPPTDIAGVGRFAGLISPQGVRFYVIKYNPQTRG
jgi:predicted enzyme related to lactoylglutathione lyase